MPLGETAHLAVNLNLTGNFNRDIGKATASIKGIATQTKSMQSQVKSSILTGVGLGAGAVGFTLLSQGVGKAIDAIGDAVDAASDLAESQSKVNVVFAEGSKEVLAWGKTAATAMGLSEQAALEAAGTFGNFIQALGNSREEAQRMSTDIVALAADLASFNNTDINEVIIALRSGLAGEAEPMRRLGVSISATRVEANILAKGIARTKEEITDAMKVSERYAIIMQDTALAQGDFARTSDGLANRQRILDARMANVSATVGRGLVPAMKLGVDVMGGFADVVLALTTAGGGDGSLDALISDLKRTAVGFQGLKGPAEDTGDLFEDLRNSAADLGLLPEFAKEREWRKALGGIQEELRLTDDDIKILITTSTQLGLTLEQTIDSLEGTGEAARDSAHEMQSQRLAIQEWGRTHQTAQAAVYDLHVETDESRKAVAAYRRAVAAAGDAITETAGQVDIAKGSFKDFWDTVREQQRRIRFFIRHPELLRQETRRIENTLDALERQRTQIEKGGIQQRERLQYQAITNLINQLRSRREEFYGVGLTVGNAAEEGMEDGFKPTLAAKINAVFGGVGGAIPVDEPRRRRKKRASGGLVTPHNAYVVGEEGPEVLYMGSQTGRVAPTSRDSLTVYARPVITAFQVGRELGRAATTRRSGAGVL